MSNIIATPYSARARVAALHAKRPKDRAAISDARRDLAAANVAAAIERNLKAAPPLTEDQVERLSDLLRGPSA